MLLVRRRLRQMVGTLVADCSDPALRSHLRGLAEQGYRANLNLLGEVVLGEAEAARRLTATLRLLARDDVDYVSVKASSVASQLDPWGYDHTLERVVKSLRTLFQAAADHRPAKFVNLDMEEYEDLRLAIDAFTRLLDEPPLRGLEAGIALQAYLPDSFDALRELVAWVRRRRESGGAGIKVRVVKGANLAMERVDAALHNWTQAPYATKAETDANYKRMLDWALQRDRVSAVRIGVASHNLFDVAWARELAGARGVADRVEFEMLQGMAPGVARAVRGAVGSLIVYTPVVAAADFDSALAYLFRRLEENASGENFLRHFFDLAERSDLFALEAERFERAVAERWSASRVPRRARRVAPATGFWNEPDTDPTDPAARAAIRAALEDPPNAGLPGELRSTAEIDELIGSARAGVAEWRRTSAADRRELLHRVAGELAARRPELIAVMASEAGKTVAEGDGEVSEAIDFARYYAERSAQLGERDGSVFEPLGLVAVVPPWNFPLSISAGGVLAALAAGNAVVLKPAPLTPRSAFAVAQACWAAGIPTSALGFVRCPDAGIGEHLIAHSGIDGIILTGAYETAELFTQLAPRTPLFAETSGKNAMIVMPDADLDLAVAALVKSAFGHAGQKCSAASLAICVGDLARSERFPRKLVDAARSAVVGTPDRLEAVIGPLVGELTPKLRRALTAPDPGQRWLLEPRQLDASGRLWSPGILDGVEGGSWFHQTECFGPVLGIMRAGDLDEALALQNGVAYGLTGGIQTLDPDHASHWLARVEVGNAYVNRGITGAIVQRQPFGGWKRSSVGAGAKAGGPNYAAQLGSWRTAAPPRLGRDPAPPVAELVASLASELDEAGLSFLASAARSDAHWWEREFGAEHDPSGLFCEANVFRYRALPGLALRVAADAAPRDVARALAAVAASGTRFELSVDPRYPGAVAAHRHRREETAGFARRAAVAPPARVRLIGSEPLSRVDLPAATFLDARAVVADGRIELARYLREQSISRTLHRFGNLVAEPGQVGRASRRMQDGGATRIGRIW
jgi:RHH-type proline utilization regulon transcriptional repressor/proline dehydrogenase/delta 1-pyrroline-5-carboxylate dehydrogenase